MILEIIVAVVLVMLGVHCYKKYIKKTPCECPNEEIISSYSPSYSPENNNFSQKVVEPEEVIETLEALNVSSAPTSIPSSGSGVTDEFNIASILPQYNESQDFSQSTTPSLEDYTNVASTLDGTNLITENSKLRYQDLRPFPVVPMVHTDLPDSGFFQMGAGRTSI